MKTMKVVTIKRYRDSDTKEIYEKGTFREVNQKRAEVLVEKGVALLVPERQAQNKDVN